MSPYLRPLTSFVCPECHHEHDCIQHVHNNTTGEDWFEDKWYTKREYRDMIKKQFEKKVPLKKIKCPECGSNKIVFCKRDGTVHCRACRFETYIIRKQE